ncbi:dickkopf-related protein 3 [Eublepharis macularius]|uniref:Dickkopf-related protein 3 n=1 Tax=Eublepharis macularius TaxID=481883 RepID=A0AA97KRB4_EUBMA|nr:dickkopf-related protein 3 [Eublepharis macularius]XP_054828966.1 dickkopf-related protein 3 [Eublepharis macularius]
MLLLRSRLLFLLIFLGVVYAAPTSDGGRKEQPEEIVLNFPRDEASLNEMFREVEELMEDTQYKLRNAVEEMEAEEDGSKQLTGVNFDQLPSNYHNESYLDTTIGNKTVHAYQEINKATDNKTGSASYSETLITSIQGGENKRNHECIIDEDCETGKYCEFSGFEYKCYACKTQHTHCSRDDECCGNQLCVWGECLKTASRGANGTICENQRDCNPGMCCAFTKDLLFPVCTPLPGEGEPCHDPSNRLLNLISWEMEPDGALDCCPCAHGLTCKMQSYSSDSLCELSFNKTQTKDMEKPLLLDEISLLDFITHDVPGDYEEILINEMQRGLEEDVSVSKELDIASDRLFANKM